VTLFFNLFRTGGRAQWLGRVGPGLFRMVAGWGLRFVAFARRRRIVRSIPERDWVAWREENGIRLGEDQRVRPVLRIARFERGGTHIEIQSYELRPRGASGTWLAHSFRLPSTPPASG
jgi:hypothetical protein